MSGRVSPDWTVERRPHCPDCGRRMEPGDGPNAVCTPDSGGCGATAPTADDPALTDAEATVVEETVSTYLPDTRRPHVEFWRSNRLLADDERTYLVVKESADAARGYFAKLFVENDGEFHTREYEVLSSVDLDPFVVPVAHELFDRWFLLEYYDGEQLAGELRRGSPRIETCRGLIADLAAWHDRQADERRTVEVGGRSHEVHYGGVHGDFNPDNVRLHGDTPIVIDWEKYRPGVQEFDALHFAAIAAVRLFPDASPAERIERMLAGVEPCRTLVSAVLETYATHRDVPVEALDDLWGVYAQYRLEHLERLAGSDGDVPETLYDHLAATDWSDASLIDA